MQSRLEDTDISRNVARDDVSHCMLSGFESNGSQMRHCRSLGQKMLKSPGKVLVTTLVIACYRALSLTDCQRDFFALSTGRRLISREAADDNVSHCILSGFESYG